MKRTENKKGIWIFVIAMAAMILLTNQVNAAVTEQVELDFDKVVLGSSKTVTVNIKNDNPAAETRVYFRFTENPCGFLTEPSMYIDLPAGETGVLRVKFAPSEEGPCSGTLYIYTRTTRNAISVQGEGVKEEKANIETLLKLFDDSVKDGSLLGNGKGKSADNRLRTLRKMIVDAGIMIENEDISEACNKLKNIYEQKMDSFATGDAILKLKDMIRQIMDGLKCK
jgi:hypothetical protein